MPAQVWRHARGPRVSVLSPLPASIEAAGVRLEIAPGGSLAGPPFGSVRRPAHWSSGRRSGGASVQISPYWTWGSEVEVRLTAPSGLGRLLWPRRRLDAVAAKLAAAAAQALTASVDVSKPAPRRRAPVATSLAG